jgi:hypothetical protein
VQTIFRKERGRKGGRRSKLKFVRETVRYAHIQIDRQTKKPGIY